MVKLSLAFECNVSDPARLRQHLLELWEERGMAGEPAPDTAELFRCLAGLDLGGPEPHEIGVEIADQTVECHKRGRSAPYWRKFPLFVDERTVLGIVDRPTEHDPPWNTRETVAHGRPATLYWRDGEPWDSHIHYHHYESGYGGRTLRFLLKDGSTREVRGPFCHDDLVDELALCHRTRVVVATKKRRYRPMENVVEFQGVLADVRIDGPKGAHKVLADQLSRAIGRTVYVVAYCKGRSIVYSHTASSIAEQPRDDHGRFCKAGS